MPQSQTQDEYTEDLSEQIDDQESENESEDELPDVPLPLHHATSLQKFQNIDDTAQTEIFDSVQKTLKVLSTDATEETQKVVEKLALEYEKIKELFIDGRKQTHELVLKATNMSAELADSAQKMHDLIETGKKDRAAVIHLKKELKKAWKSVEENAEKDLKAKEVISSLKNEVSALKIAADASAPSDGTILSGSMAKNKLIAIQMEQEELIKKLNRGKMEIESELSNSNNEIKRLKTELEEEIAKTASFVKEKEYLQEEISTLKDYLAAKKSEYEREVRAKERFEQQLRQMSENLEKKEQEIRNKLEEGKALKESLNKTEGLLQGEQARCAKIENERDTIYSQHVRLQQDFDQKEAENVVLTNKSHEQTRKLKTWQEEVTRLRESFKEVTKAKQALMKKYKLLEEAKIASEMERDSLKSGNAHLQRELESTRKDLEQATKNFEMVTRERDISQKNFVKSTSASLKQYSVLKLSEQTKRNLEQEISGYKDEAQKMRKIIYALEKERDNKSAELSKFMQELAEQTEEIKMKDVTIFDCKKKITDVEKKLKEQQALYESVRTDRNVYSKNFLESQDEIQEMKRKLKIMNHQVEQLKEEIASRETVLVKEHFEHAKLEKEKEALLLQIAKLQQQHDESHLLIQNQKCEEEKLRHIIAEADHERIRQKKEYESVVQERDILGTQLIRRNDELSLLYEKIKIQTSTLNKGEIQYRERLEDIRVLRLEIKKLRREKAMLQTETQNAESLRNEIFKLQRDILRERTRVKVLEEELESPMNIHRWRKLAGSDPSTFELISKIQTLQKRLIAKTEEVVEKELIIQQKDKLYNDIKKVLQRQPGPEIMEELQTVRAAVKSKVRESKALASELNMYHSQVNEYKFEIERLNRELQDLKSKYYQLRKKQQTEKRIKTAKEFSEFDGRMTPFDDKASNRSTPKIKPNLVSGPKFSGGGFNMSVGHHVVQDIPAENFINHEPEYEEPILSPEPESVAGNIPEQLVEEPQTVQVPIVEVIPTTIEPLLEPEVPSADLVASNVLIENLPPLPETKSDHLQIEQPGLSDDPVATSTVNLASSNPDVNE